MNHKNSTTRSRLFLLTDKDLPPELLAEKICTIIERDCFWEVETPLGMRYLIEIFDDGKSWGLTPHIKATFLDSARTFGRLKCGEMFCGKPCPQQLRRNFVN